MTGRTIQAEEKASLPWHKFAIPVDGTNGCLATADSKSNAMMSNGKETSGTGFGHGRETLRSCSMRLPATAAKSWVVCGEKIIRIAKLMRLG
jgi:hypothetical protein